VRVRLRPTPDLAEIYTTPHQHEEWADHRVRVDVTTTLGAHIAQQGGSLADLSCGDAAIAKRLQASHNLTVHLGDYAPGYPICGPIEETINQIPDVGLFVCSETVEHLDDPDTVLKQIRGKAANLLLSTPDGETDDGNPEHVWGWDSDAVRDMLVAAGWEPLIHTVLDLRPAGFMYAYQIWACR
jgi:hypothetical protein